MEITWSDKMEDLVDEITSTTFRLQSNFEAIMEHSYRGDFDNLCCERARLLRERQNLVSRLCIEQERIVRLDIAGYSRF